MSFAYASDRFGKVALTCGTIPLVKALIADGYAGRLKCVVNTNMGRLHRSLDRADLLSALRAHKAGRGPVIENNMRLHEYTLLYGPCNVFAACAYARESMNRALDHPHCDLHS